MNVERIFNSLASETRLNILRLVAERPGATVNDVAEQLGTSQTNASKHLTVLRDAGALRMERGLQSKHHHVVEDVLELVRRAEELTAPV